MKHWISTLLVAVAALTLTADAIAQAGTEVRVRESSNRSMAAAQADAYNGPKARIAVARFENKTADSMNWYSPSIGDGMADMLTTALVNSGRYIVLERMALEVEELFIRGDAGVTDFHGSTSTAPIPAARAGPGRSGSRHREPNRR